LLQDAACLPIQPAWRIVHLSTAQYDDLEAMPGTVHLNEIIDALEIPSDESLSCLDLDAGQVVTVSEYLLREAEEHGEEEPNLPDWQKAE
jgi:hypothetical protein